LLSSVEQFITADAGVPLGCQRLIIFNGQTALVSAAFGGGECGKPIDQLGWVVGDGRRQQFVNPRQALARRIEMTSQLGYELTDFAGYDIMFVGGSNRAVRLALKENIGMADPRRAEYWVRLQNISQRESDDHCRFGSVVHDKWARADLTH
jgi:hypothetical protein